MIGIVFCGMAVELKFLKLGSLGIHLQGNILKALLAVGYIVGALFIYQQDGPSRFSLTSSKPSGIKDGLRMESSSADS